MLSRLLVLGVLAAGRLSKGQDVVVVGGMSLTLGQSEKGRKQVRKWVLLV